MHPTAIEDAFTVLAKSLAAEALADADHIAHRVDPYGIDERGHFLDHDRPDPFLAGRNSGRFAEALQQGEVHGCDRSGLLVDGCLSQMSRGSAVPEPYQKRAI